MNECEAAMWPHWPVHASLMYVSFWFYYTLDRKGWLKSFNLKLVLNSKFITQTLPKDALPFSVTMQRAH